MHSGEPRKLLARLLLALVAVALVGSCSVDPSRLSADRTGLGAGSYRIHVEFPTVLNLPARARVMLNGAQVGQLESVTIVAPTGSRRGFARADVRIDGATALPVSTIVQLRQNTILGDIFIGLDVPRDALGGPVMTDGYTVDPAATRAPLQVEDVLSGLAVFVSGGALTSMQQVVERVNAALPANPAETRHIVGVLKNNLVDLAANQRDLDTLLRSAERNVAAIRDNKVALDFMFTPEGATTVTGIANSLINLVGIIGALGALADALAWLAPLLREANAAARAFVPMLMNPGRPLNLSAPSNFNTVVAIVRDKIIPWVQRPQVNVRGVRVHTTTPGDGGMSVDDQTSHIVATLRMIGLVR